MFSNKKDPNIIDHGSNKSLNKKANFIIRFFLVGVLLAILFFNSFYTINEQEQAVITTFGIPKTVNEPGLQFKIPVIQKVRKVDTTIKGLYIGYDPLTNESFEDESIMITNDFNFVNIDFFVEYRVSDPVRFLYASENPVTIFKNIVQSDIRTVVGSFTVDSVITTGKYQIQADIKEMIMNKLEENDIGIQLVNVTIQDAEPPTIAVMEAFKAVETAKQGKETAINNANKYRNEEMPKAEADAYEIMQKAESEKVERVNQAIAEVALFNEMYKEYIKNPTLTKKRMFYEAMEELLPSLKIIIESENGNMQTILPIEPFND